MSVSHSWNVIISIKDNKIYKELSWGDVNCESEANDYELREFKDCFGYDLKEFLLKYYTEEDKEDVEATLENNEFPLYWLNEAFWNFKKENNGEPKDAFGNNMFLLSGSSF